MITEVAPDRREELIAAAIRLCSERPYEDVSVDDIAAEAGVAKGLLYYYFGSKRGLYATGLERMAIDMRECIVGAIAGMTDPMQILRAALDAHLAYVERRATGYRALLGTVAAHPEVRAILERERENHRRLMQASLPPEVPRTPAVNAALSGWMHFVDGAVFDWLERRELDAKQVRELCARTLVSAVMSALSLEQEQAPVSS